MASSRIKKEILARVLLGIIILGIPLGIMIWGRLTSEPSLLVQAAIPENGGWNPGTIKTKVGQPLNLRFTSDDVVHGFSVGKLDFPEIDVIPGEITQTSLIFSEPGRYVYYCTRWCSPNHWRMRGTIIVEGESQVEESPDPPLYVAMGLDIDQPRQTDIIPEIKPSIKVGKDIMVAISRENLEPYLESSYLSTKSPTEAWLSLRGETFSEDLSDQDIWNLIAALWNSSTMPESLRAGEQLFSQNCAACHGTEGDGEGIFAQKYSPGEIGSSDLLKDITSPANFTLPENMLATSSAVLEGKLLRGGMGTGMPNFGPIFSSSELWSIINYIWNFQFSD
ncbi:MAG: c-type cytochrome [Anaerolineales bacterium]|nr:c-type cytochrome [Anaerolineales bacterium]